jgi:predicted ABC-type ATPase
MQVVAGPSGSGKSSLFPVDAAGVDHFNVDDRCARLNRGSYVGIGPEIRAQANAECEAFIARHITTRTSFAVETTLRTDITFRQGNAAKANGFVLLMEYISAGSPEECVKRVTIRADRGGHSASPTRIRATYAASIKNLLRALREFDVVTIYDNSRGGKPPVRLLEAAAGRGVTFQARRLPAWLRDLLRGSEFA